MVWGLHLISTIYGPGLLGSPRKTAIFAPGSASFHSNWFGSRKIRAAGLRSAWAGPGSIRMASARAGTPNHHDFLKVRMFPPVNRARIAKQGSSVVLDSLERQNPAKHLN